MRLKVSFHIVKEYNFQGNCESRNNMLSNKTFFMYIYRSHRSLSIKQKAFKKKKKLTVYHG